MERSTMARDMLIPALASLALVTFGQAALAGRGSDDSDDKRATVGLTRGASASSRTQQTIVSPAVTLFVETPTGTTVRLVYVPDGGWIFRDGKADPPLSGTALARTTAPQRVEAPAITNEPLTVFIDGPSGFTYVWMRDAGWKFVGRIADKRP